ncbi:MAG: ComEA family DNA-binding protein [Phycisphaerales bacterium]
MGRPLQSDGATIGPARAGAAGALGGAAAVGLVWALAGRAPLPQAPPSQPAIAAPIAAPETEHEPAARAEPTPATPVAEPDPTESAPADTWFAQPDPAPANTLALRVNLNQATPEELELLPGIGPVLAQRIVDERARNGRFTSLLDFQRVPGIGEKTAANLAPHVRFD